MARKEKKTVSQKLELDLPFGLPGIDDDTINPIARALDRIVREGKPLQKVGTVIVELPVDGQLYPFWLGAFVFSAGNQLVFFPGYSKPLGRLVKYKGESKISENEAAIDHVTLEKDRGSWHMTTYGSQEHFSGAPSLPLAGESVLWFGMSIAYPFSLHSVRQKTILEWHVPATDAHRRLENIMQALHDVDHMRLRLVDDSLEQPPKEHFHHFIVTVGDPDMMTTAIKEFALPHGSPFVEPPLPKDDLLVFGSGMTMSLPSHCAIQITAMRLPGKMTLPLHFTGQSKPQANIIEMIIHQSPDDTKS